MRSKCSSHNIHSTRLEGSPRVIAGECRLDRICERGRDVRVQEVQVAAQGHA